MRQRLTVLHRRMWCLFNRYIQPCSLVAVALALGWRWRIPKLPVWLPKTGVDAKVHYSQKSTSFGMHASQDKQVL